MEMVQNLAQITRLQEENDNMKCQLEAYKNEIELTRKEQDNTGETKVREEKCAEKESMAATRNLKWMSFLNRRRDTPVQCCLLCCVKWQSVSCSVNWLQIPHLLTARTNHPPPSSAAVTSFCW